MNLPCFRLLRIQRRIFSASIAFLHFTSNTWEFKNSNMLWLSEQILPSDKDDFGIDGFKNVDVKQYCKVFTNAAAVYLLKESENRTHARKHYTRYNETVISDFSYTCILNFEQKPQHTKYMSLKTVT
jgi:hypothetical protein